MAHFDFVADRALDETPRRPPADNQLLPPAVVVRTLALGQETLAASLLWVKALAYFGEHFTRDRQYRWLTAYIDIIVELDPRFRRVFEWAGVAVMYGGRIDNQAVRASNAILERGLEHFPDDWQLAFMLGFNYVFELNTPDPEQKRRNIEIGLEYLRRASNQKGAPPHILGLVASLYKRVGWLEIAASYLEEAYLHATDPRLRDELGERLRQYRSEAQLLRLREEVAQHDEAWRESFPYLPVGLFRLVGPRVDLRVGPWTELLPPTVEAPPDPAGLDEAVLQGLAVRAAQPASTLADPAPGQVALPAAPDPAGAPHPVREAPEGGESPAQGEHRD
jgi:hypothetical protein